MLSFGDEEEEFQQEVRKKAKKSNKKLMSSHDLLDDKKLKAEVDETLLQKIADTSSNAGGVSSTSDSSTNKKEAARASLKAAVASAAAKKNGDGSAVESAQTAEDLQDSSSGKALKDAESRKRPGSGGKLSATSDQDEYTRLREELRSSKKAVSVLMGSKAKEQEDAKAFHDMLTPLQQQRQKYLQKKKASSRSGRERETLEKLMQFKAKLEVVNQGGGGENAEASQDKEKESYHGQVLDDDSDVDDDKEARSAKEKDLSWMTAKLKFKKHIDVSVFLYAAASYSVLSY